MFCEKKKKKKNCPDNLNYYNTLVTGNTIFYFVTKSSKFQHINIVRQIGAFIKFFFRKSRYKQAKQTVFRKHPL